MLHNEVFYVKIHWLDHLPLGFIVIEFKYTGTTKLLSVVIANMLWMQYIRLVWKKKGMFFSWYRKKLIKAACLMEGMWDECGRIMIILSRSAE